MERENEGRGGQMEKEEERGGGEVVRIFVGGLGERVSRDDILKMFSSSSSSSLGVIQALEFVRSKGRCFAFLDLLPSSPHSLSKFFSTYSGCLWKGGRLRLERAKEHYLARLRREWDEDFQASILADPPAPNRIMESPSKNKKLLISDKNKKLRIFFPRLNKVKSIPFTGTGKHKYSFRRAEGPSLPTYFCDCEEHSHTSHDAKEDLNPVLEDSSHFVISKQELDMMNSVMNKLFEKDNVAKVLSSEIELAEKEDSFIPALNEPQLEENEEYSSEKDDDLIINVVNRGQQTSLSYQSRVNERQVSESKPTQDLLKKKRKNTASPSKKRKSGLHDQKVPNKSASDPTEPESRANLWTSSSGLEPGDAILDIQQSVLSLSQSKKSSWRELLGDKGNNAFNILDILQRVSTNQEEQSKSSELHSSIDCKHNMLLSNEDQKGKQGRTNVVEEPAENLPVKPDSASSKSGRGSAWLHKFSWTQLVGGNNSSSFSITQILPDVPFEMQGPTKNGSTKVNNPACIKHSNTFDVDRSGTTADDSIDLEMGNKGVIPSTLQISQPIVIANKSSPPVVQQMQNSVAKQICNKDTSIGETCSFMRTTASMRDWTNTKAAISGSHKRKRIGR
uniref:RRM domain-containing protein n=2 Tax=Rhizophora mucronata TaxID=61149 RepID=A0A2P2J8L9_RHIMU